MNVKKKNFLLLLMSFICSASTEKKVICYYGSWATYRHGNGKCEVKDIDPNVCTHLIYGFVGINEDATIRIMDPWLELPDNWGKDNFGEFNRLKNINPTLKTIIAIGGWNEGSAKFSKVANDPSLRSTFAKNAAEFTSTHGFDGMDMDWEYPGQRDTPNKDEDKQAFSLLLAEMRQEFDKRKLLLSAAVAAVKSSASLSYDIPALSRYLDIINVMTYDFHGAWDPATGHNAPLLRYESENEDSFNVKNAINYWLSEGAPAEKLILGIPLYGRSFRLADPTQNSVGAPSTGEGIGGQYTSQNGMIGYNELCEKRLTESWPEVWDDQVLVPYTFKDSNWISYDNERSIGLKVEYAMSKNLGGAMVWSIETDDFKGICHPVKFPLLRKINDGVGRVIGNLTTTTTTTSTSTPPTMTTTKTTTTSPTSTTTTSSTTSSRPSTSLEPSTSNKPSPTTSTDTPTNECSSPGYFQNPHDCRKFYQCVLLEDGVSYKVFEYYCPIGLLFDDTLIACNFPHLVKCH